jgi:hypothetical protein
MANTICFDGDAETFGPKDAVLSLSVGLAFGGAACAVVALVVFGVLFKPEGATAVPSFAMQNRSAVFHLSHRFPRANALRTPLQNQRLYDGQRHNQRQSTAPGGNFTTDIHAH